MEYFRQFRKYAMWYMSGMKTMNTARSVTYAASGQIIKYITPGSSYVLWQFYSSLICQCPELKVVQYL